MSVIVEALGAGYGLEEASRLASVAPRTVYEWIARDRGDDTRRPATEPYVSFAREIDEALAPRETEFAQFAQGGFPDTLKRRRAREDEAPRPSREAPRLVDDRNPRAWRSKAARRRGSITFGLLDRTF